MGLRWHQCKCGLSWWRHQMEHFPRYWLFVRGIHRSPVISPYKGQWRGDLMFSLICVWINGWVNNSEIGDLRRYLAHYDVIVMIVDVGLLHWRHFHNNLISSYDFWSGSGKTAAECMSVCETVGNDNCKGVDYYRLSQKCYLNTASHQNTPLHSHLKWDYYINWW